MYGHGSGDITLAFSTAYTLPHLAETPMPQVAMVHETLMDGLFVAADAVEQAIDARAVACGADAGDAMGTPGRASVNFCLDCVRQQSLLRLGRDP